MTSYTPGYKNFVNKQNRMMPNMPHRPRRAGANSVNQFNNNRYAGGGGGAGNVNTMPHLHPQQQPQQPQQQNQSEFYEHGYYSNHQNNHNNNYTDANSRAYARSTTTTTTAAASAATTNCNCQKCGLYSARMMTVCSECWSEFMNRPTWEHLQNRINEMEMRGQFLSNELKMWKAEFFKAKEKAMREKKEPKFANEDFLDEDWGNVESMKSQSEESGRFCFTGDDAISGTNFISFNVRKSSHPMSDSTVSPSSSQQQHQHQQQSHKQQQQQPSSSSALYYAPAMILSSDQSTAIKQPQPQQTKPSQLQRQQQSRQKQQSQSHKSQDQLQKLNSPNSESTAQLSTPSLPKQQQQQQQQPSSMQTTSSSAIEATPPVVSSPVVAVATTTQQSPREQQLAKLATSISSGDTAIVTATDTSSNATATINDGFTQKSTQSEPDKQLSNSTRVDEPDEANLKIAKIRDLTATYLPSLENLLSKMKTECDKNRVKAYIQIVKGERKMSLELLQKYEDSLRPQFSPTNPQQQKESSGNFDSEDSTCKRPRIDQSTSSNFASVKLVSSQQPDKSSSASSISAAATTPPGSQQPKQQQQQQLLSSVESSNYHTTRLLAPPQPPPPPPSMATAQSSLSRDKFQESVGTDKENAWLTIKR